MNEYAGMILAAIVFSILVVCTTIAVINTSNNNHDTSVVCVNSGGSWVDGKKCDR